MKKAEQKARKRKESEPIQALEAPGFDEIQPVETQDVESEEIVD